MLDSPSEEQSQARELYYILIRNGEAKQTHNLHNSKYDSPIPSHPLVCIKELTSKR